MFIWNPQDYAQSSAAQLQWAHELISRLRFAGNETILDIGCGDGKITAEFAAHVPRGHVIGIDLAPEMIDYARATFPPERYLNLEFHRMDARDIVLEHECNLVFSNAALHWVDDKRAVLLGAARLLKPGGRIVISCGGRGNAAEIARVLEAVIRRPQWAPYFKDFDFQYYFLGPEDYTPWIAETGLLPVRLELVPKDMTHAGREGLAAWLRTTWLPYTARIPEERRQEFLAEWMDEYLAHHSLDENGLAHVEMVRLEVDAVRP